MLQVLSMGSFAEVLRGPVRDELAAGVKENFDNASGPQGQAWPARKDPSGNHPLLVLSGKLRFDAAHGQAEVTDREIAVGTDLVYAATHQYGRAGANIPARPYMGVNDRRLDRIGEMIADRGQQLLDGV